MNPVTARLLLFIGQRALGAIVSCAAVMAFKAALEKHQAQKAYKDYMDRTAAIAHHEVVDPETGEVYAI